MKIQQELSIEYKNKFGKNATPNKLTQIDNFNEENINFIADNLYFWYNRNPKNLGVALTDYQKDKSIYCQSEFNTTLSIVNRIFDAKIKNNIMRCYYNKIKK